MNRSSAKYIAKRLFPIYFPIFPFLFSIYCSGEIETHNQGSYKERGGGKESLFLFVILENSHPSDTKSNSQGWAIFKALGDKCSVKSIPNVG